MKNKLLVVMLFVAVVAVPSLAQTPGFYDRATRICGTLKGTGFVKIYKDDQVATIKIECEGTDI